MTVTAGVIVFIKVFVAKKAVTGIVLSVGPLNAVNTVPIMSKPNVRNWKSLLTSVTAVSPFISASTKDLFTVAVQRINSIKKPLYRQEPALM